MNALRVAVLSAIAASLLCARSASAELPSWLRTENSRVRDGNEQLEKGDAKGALESYNHASRELPEAPGVQLNRGLALLKQGEFAKSREALLSATQPSAPADVRADAYEDLSLAFYREADGLAGQNKHKDAQKLFREALDAAKRSLRLRPGDPNTAWNMELASRRIREEDEKQKQEDDKEKQKQQDKKENDKDNKDQKPDEQNQDKDKQDSDSKKDDQKGDSGDKKDQPQPKPEEGKDKQDQAKAPPKPDKQEPERQPAEPSEDKSNPAKALPPEAAQALDALEGSEENFERHRARQRAARERRAPEKDW
jgi:Ca-activated chloride channel homolog